MMNKFSFLTLLALVGCVSASPVNISSNTFDNDDVSQLALFEDDAGEIAGLTDEKKIFSDFCIQSRDDVKVFLKSALNEGAAKVFNIMFNTVEDVTLELSRVHKETVQQGVELIKESGVKADKSEESEESTKTLTKEEIEAEVKQNVAKVQNSGLLSNIGKALRTVINAVIETISLETSKRLALLREQFNGENARDQIEAACRTISYQIKSNLNDSLKKAKSDLLASSQAESLASVIEATRVENVGCTTTGRISLVSRFCDVLLTVGPVFYPLVGL